MLQRPKDAVMEMASPGMGATLTVRHIGVLSQDAGQQVRIGSRDTAQYPTEPSKTIAMRRFQHQARKPRHQVWIWKGDTGDQDVFAKHVCAKHVMYSGASMIVGDRLTGTVQRQASRNFRQVILMDSPHYLAVLKNLRNASIPQQFKSHLLKCHSSGLFLLVKCHLSTGPAYDVSYLLTVMKLSDVVRNLSMY